MVYTYPKPDGVKHLPKFHVLQDKFHAPDKF